MKGESDESFWSYRVSLLGIEEGKGMLIIIILNSCDIKDMLDAITKTKPYSFSSINAGLLIIIR